MVISKKISDSFSKSLADNKLISDEYVDSYSYCMELMLDILIFNGSLILIGCFLHEFLNSLIFILALVPLKMVAGGAHANSRIGCSLISYSVFFSVIILSNVLHINGIMLLIIAAISVFGITVLSPVGHANKHFSASQKRKLKKISFILSIGLFITSTVMIQFNEMKFSFTITACLLIIFINQIAGMLINLRRQKDDS